jgi:putative endonuclease
MHKIGYVYILTNKSNRVLYTGVTNNLRRRIGEHKRGRNPGFTQRYNVTKLVYFEIHQRIADAIMREKQIKAGSRQKKIDLVISMNPGWRDLATDLLPRETTGTTDRSASNKAVLNPNAKLNA